MILVEFTVKGYKVSVETKRKWNNQYALRVQKNESWAIFTRDGFLLDGVDENKIRSFSDTSLDFIQSCMLAMYELIPFRQSYRVLGWMKTILQDKIYENQDIYQSYQYFAPSVDSTGGANVLDYVKKGILKRKHPELYEEHGQRWR